MRLRQCIPGQWYVQWYSLGGIFLEVSKLSSGKCALSFQNFQFECTVWYLLRFQSLLMKTATPCSNFQIQGISEWLYVWISDWWCVLYWATPHWWASNFIKYIAVYNHTSCKVGVVRGPRLSMFLIAWVSSWGISYERSSPTLDATIAEKVLNLQTTRIINHPNCIMYLIF